MALPKIARQTGVVFEGLGELQDMLENIAPGEVNNILRNTVHGIAGTVRDRMRQRVKKDSRDLEKSIYAKRRRGKPGFPISEVRMRGTPHPHGLMLESGTSRTKAQPFIKPTVLELGPAMPTIYREEFFAKLAKSLARQARK